MAGKSGLAYYRAELFFAWCHLQLNRSAAQDGSPRAAQLKVHDLTEKTLFN